MATKKLTDYHVSLGTTTSSNSLDIIVNDGEKDMRLRVADLGLDSIRTRLAALEAAIYVKDLGTRTSWQGILDVGAALENAADHTHPIQFVHQQGGANAYTYTGVFINSFCEQFLYQMFFWNGDILKRKITFTDRYHTAISEVGSFLEIL